MLSCRILNSTATLNDFDSIGALEFIPGEQITLVIRLIQPQRPDELRYTPPATAILTLSLPNKDGTDLAKVMTAFTDDRSIWSTELSEAETEALASGNFTFDVDVLGNGTQIIKGFYGNGLSIIITGAC